MKFAFRTKLFLPLLLSWLCLLIVFAVNTLHSRTLRLEERKIQLINAAELVESIVKEYAVFESSGALTQESARSHALSRIKSLRFGESGYFLVFDEQKVLMNPIKAELVGTPLDATRDVDGRQVYLDAIRMAEGRGGFTNFLWSKHGSNQPLHKLAYTTAYKPWNWYIMTGLYVDDLEQAFQVQLVSSLKWLAVIGVLLTTLVWLAARSVERSIGGDPEHVAKAAQSIAAGDLKVDLQIRADDETSVMAAVKKMRNALSTIVGEVRAGTDLIATTSAQIAVGNIDLSNRTERQAWSLQETAASMEEIASNVQQSIEDATKASEMAASTLKMAQHGGTVVAEVVDTMAAINLASDRIVDIISVINGIAFQTNILALKAAVESARAGEYGKGFAVVASEVGALAQRAALAAKEIEGLVKDSVSKATAGAELVEKAGDTMRNIVSGVNEVNAKLYAIAATTRDQGIRIETINGAINQIDQVESQNAALVEEAASASDALREQASKLVKIVSVFRAGEEGSSQSGRWFLGS